MIYFPEWFKLLSNEHKSIIQEALAFGTEYPVYMRIGLELDPVLDTYILATIDFYSREKYEDYVKHEGIWSFHTAQEYVQALILHTELEY